MLRWYGILPVHHIFNIMCTEQLPASGSWLHHYSIILYPAPFYANGSCLHRCSLILCTGQRLVSGSWLGCSPATACCATSIFSTSSCQVRTQQIKNIHFTFAFLKGISNLFLCLNVYFWLALYPVSFLIPTRFVLNCLQEFHRIMYWFIHP